MIRTRFAPSNTGFLHLGSARSALYAFAFARKNQGSFSLRIEDSDASRSTKESLEDIVSGLRWLGIEWDIGPKVDPNDHVVLDNENFQSNRGEIYQSHVDRLLKDGKAYEKDETIFFKMPSGNYEINDLILGKIEIKAEENQDFVIRRKDGSFIFHLCNVVDDAIGGMTHLIKGNDHISNFPKHLALFKAFGYNIPYYCHLPLILDVQGAKLSKRRTDQYVLIKDFRANGYIPESIVNLLGVLGWTNPDGKDEFDLDYICDRFEIKDCNKTNAKYDPKKLDRLNKDHITKLNFNEFRERANEYGHQFHNQIWQDLVSSGKWKNVLRSYQSRSIVLKDLFTNTDWVLNKPTAYNTDAVEKFLKKNNHQGHQALASFVKGDLFKTKRDWTKEKVAKTLEEYSQIINLSMNQLCQPIRIAMTGSIISPPIDDVFVILGQEECKTRIERLLQANQNG